MLCAYNPPDSSAIDWQGQHEFFVSSLLFPLLHNRSLPDEHSCSSNGYELVDIGVGGGRAITGGTGKDRKAHGEAQQILLGHNPSDGVSLRFALKVK